MSDSRRLADMAGGSKTWFVASRTMRAALGTEPIANRGDSGTFWRDRELQRAAQKQDGGDEEQDGGEESYADGNVVGGRRVGRRVEEALHPTRFSSQRELRKLGFAGPIPACGPSAYELDFYDEQLRTWHTCDEEDNAYLMVGYVARAAAAQRQQLTDSHVAGAQPLPMPIDGGEPVSAAAAAAAAAAAKEQSGLAAARLRAFLSGESNTPPAMLLHRRLSPLNAQPRRPRRLEIIRAEIAADDAAMRKTALPSYVENWLREPWIGAIATDPNMAGLFDHKKLKKEMTEAWGVFELLSAELAKLAPPPGAKFVMFDVCSGRGFLSVLLSRKFPDATVYMIDNDKDMNVNHVKSLENVRISHADIMCDDGAPFREWLRDELETWKGVDGQRPVFCVMLGVHLCGMLSERFVRAFNELVSLQLSHLSMLSPCCIPKGGRMAGGVSTRAHAAGRDPFGFWIDELRDMYNDKMVDVEMTEDEHVMSVKNRYIMGRRRAQG
jgi:hypothetical protein